MEFKTYKQRCPQGDGEDFGKIICGLKKATVQDAITLGRHGHKLNLNEDDIRPMHLTIEEIGNPHYSPIAIDKLIDCEFLDYGVCLKTSQCSARALDYMRITLGHVPEWHLAQVFLRVDHVEMVFVYFGEGEPTRLITDLSLEYDGKIRIDLDPCEGMPHERYTIEVVSSKEELSEDDLGKEARIVYYVDEKKVYSSILRKNVYDDLSSNCYEIITEA